LYVDLGVKDAGTYALALENLIISFNDQAYAIDANEQVDVTFHVPGSIDPDDANVEVIDIVPQDNYVTLDKDNTAPVVVDIYLENDHNLPVKGIKIGGVAYSESQITVISSTHIQVTAEMSNNSSNPSNNSLYFSNISFERNGEIIVSKLSSHVNGFVYRVYDFDYNGTVSNEFIHISTPEQLLAISENTTKKVYILDNDIDMSAYTWEPIGTYDDPFIGAFIGQGFTISNLYIDMTLPILPQAYHYIGLFGYTKAFISDLNIDNMQITLHSDVENYIHVGTVAGYSTSDFVNVHVIDSTITVDGVIKGAIGGLVGTHEGDIIRTSADTDITNVTFTSASSTMRLYVGGLVGDKHAEDIRRSYATGDINIAISSPQTIFAGGLAGVASATNAIISNSYATGDLNITSDYYSRMGGLVGNSYETTIDNTYASGDVHASSGKLGGLIGQSDGFVNSSFATGTVSCDSGTVGKVFGIGNTYRFDKMYAYDAQEVFNGDTPTDGSDHYYIYLGVASKVQFNDIDYYTDFLGWSMHFYDFGNLDIENGILPTSIMLLA